MTVEGLVADRVSVSYGGVQAARDVSLALEPGTLTSFVGPNGSGKSTALAALARLVKPSSGTVLLDGRTIAGLPSKAVARRLALLPQGAPLLSEVTVRELVGFGRYPHQSLLGIASAEDRDAVAWALAAAGLEELAERPADRLSGGERQRAWIAMALAQRTGILLLDEPTTYLDIRHQVEVLRLVRRLNLDEGLTVAMAIHDLNQALAFSDRVVLMRAGAVVASGPPGEVVTADQIRRVFGVDVHVVPGPNGTGAVCVPVYHHPTPEETR